MPKIVKSTYIYLYMTPVEGTVHFEDIQDQMLSRNEKPAGTIILWMFALPYTRLPSTK